MVRALSLSLSPPPGDSHDQPLTRRALASSRAGLSTIGRFEGRCPIRSTRLRPCQSPPHSPHSPHRSSIAPACSARGSLSVQFPPRSARVDSSGSAAAGTSTPRPGIRRTIWTVRSPRFWRRPELPRANADGRPPGIRSSPIARPQPCTISRSGPDGSEPAHRPRLLNWCRSPPHPPHGAMQGVRRNAIESASRAPTSRSFKASAAPRCNEPCSISPEPNRFRSSSPAQTPHSEGRFVPATALTPPRGRPGAETCSIAQRNSRADRGSEQSGRSPSSRTPWPTPRSRA